jgi:hypothetical protein
LFYAFIDWQIINRSIGLLFIYKESNSRMSEIYKL